MRTFPVVEMDFHPEKNLVEFLFCPASINWEVAKKAGDALSSNVIPLLLAAAVALFAFSRAKK